MIPPRDAVLHSALGEHGGRLAIGGSEGSPDAVRHDFSVSLNAYGPAAVVRRAIAESRVDEYPDPHCRVARRAAAERWSRPAFEIGFGAGAAELIHAVCFAYVRPGDPVLVVGPAFGEYARAAMLYGADIASFNIGQVSGGIDRLASVIERRRPRLVFAATPMNPTGTALDLAVVRQLADACHSADSLLVLDQAYDAFTAHPLGTPALPGHSHVLHLRSLTKDHALAGVRVAFAVGPSDVVDAVERVRVPWSASTAAQAAGIAAMTDDAMLHVSRTTAQLRGEAARIRGALAEHGVECVSSTTHFFLVRCDDATSLRKHLLAAAGILVRDCASFGMPDCIRVAARLPDDNDELIDALIAAVASRRAPPRAPAIHAITFS